MAQIASEKKPLDLIYGINDRIPVVAAIPLVIQQIAMLSIDLLIPVMIIDLIGGPASLAQSFVSLMMIGMGIGIILQAWRKGPLGSGFFCAEETGFLYFQASVLAAKAGGLPLLFGMTIISGLFQMFLSKIIQYVRFLFPTEVAGLMVAMSGLAIIPPTMSAFFGIEEGGGCLRCSVSRNRINYFSYCSRP